MARSFPLDVDQCAPLDERSTEVTVDTFCFEKLVNTTCGKFLHLIPDAYFYAVLLEPLGSHGARVLAAHCPSTPSCRLENITSFLLRLL